MHSYSVLLEKVRHVGSHNKKRLDGYTVLVFSLNKLYMLATIIRKGWANQLQCFPRTNYTFRLWYLNFTTCQSCANYFEYSSLIPYDSLFFSALRFSSLVNTVLSCFLFFVASPNPTFCISSHWSIHLCFLINAKLSHYMLPSKVI